MPLFALPRTTWPRFFLGGLAGLAAIAAAVVPQVWHRPATLLAKARKIAVVGDWDPKHDNYFWLSGQEALVVTQAAKRAYGDANPVTVRRLNTATGALTEDLPLEAALHKANVDGRVPNWQLSPDTRWLLGEANLHTNRELWVAARTDGSREVVRPHQADEEEDTGLFALWRPDSRSWVQLYEQANMVHAAIYRLDTPAIVNHVENTNFGGNVAVGFYSQDRIFCLRPETGDGGGIGIMDYGVDAGSAPVKNFIQDIPANMDVQEVVLSPDRTRLAWKFAVKPLPLGIQATINSRYVRHSAPAEAGLWTSDLNFNHLQKIGTLDIRDDHISCLRWTPDGQQLSFINNGALYTVPIR